VQGAENVRAIAHDWLARHAPPGTGVVTFMRYAADTSFNPAVPATLDSRATALEFPSNVQSVADDPKARLVVLHEDLFRESERLGDADPRPEIRALMQLVAPGGRYRLVAKLKQPVRMLGIDFDRWFQTDFLMIDPEIRIYARDAG
jgi:hypothetical protein